ncbi:MAG: hypothetical protein V4588_04655 [Pseudomonadota bacterium]
MNSAAEFTLGKQKGAALLIFFLILILMATSYLIPVINSSSIKNERDAKTRLALAEAKAALIGRAVTDATIPGSLPCPSASSVDGTSELFAGNACPSYIGWFPWHTLKVADLRDGAYEQLLYALSPNYRDDDSAQPLNSDTPGMLSVDGRNDIVAVIFAPGTQISQSRPSNNIQDYLEGENANGDNLYSGINALTANDQLITITRDEIMQAVQKRIAREVVNALNAYFATNLYFPSPADFSDASCWDNAAIPAGCNSLPPTMEGRIPANPSIAWNPTSILSGSAGAGFWFQNNGWREMIYYAVSALCADGTANCANGDLTLLNQAATLVNQKVVIVVSGRRLGAARATATLADYLEDENATIGNKIFSTINTMPVPFNDFAISIP